MIYPIKSIIVSLAVFLNTIHFGKLTTTEEICSASPSPLAPICYSCIQQTNCLSVPPIDPECLRDQICSMDSTDPVDICTDISALPDPSTSRDDICACKNLGCYVDPYNNEYHVNCLVEGLTISIEPCTAGELFDIESCSCSSDLICPACGTIPNEQGVCQKSYILCSGPEPIIDECPGDYCYSEDACLCTAGTSTCPICGSSPIEGVADRYLYCKDGANCEVDCPPNYIFDEATCVCVIGSTTSTTSTTTSTMSTTSTTTTTTATTSPPAAVCSECGLMNGESSCNEYYACDENGITSGPYYCPVSTCFDAPTCSCRQ